jgi:hypothetical protein
MPFDLSEASVLQKEKRTVLVLTCQLEVVWNTQQSVRARGLYALFARAKRAA